MPTPSQNRHTHYKLVPHSRGDAHEHAVINLRQTGRVSAGIALSDLQPGTLIKLPAGDPQAAPSSAAIAATDARRSRGGPHKGIVAVKVQYPNAYPTMALDLGNVKTAAAFLQKTELKFDLTSAVKELAKQIKLEFDFSREAKIMDDISSQLQVAAQTLSGTVSLGLDSCVGSIQSHVSSPSAIHVPCICSYVWLDHHDVLGVCCRLVLEHTVMLEV